LLRDLDELLKGKVAPSSRKDILEGTVLIESWMAGRRPFFPLEFCSWELEAGMGLTGDVSGDTSLGLLGLHLITT
jgi:hypothetical protein